MAAQNKANNDTDSHGNVVPVGIQGPTSSRRYGAYQGEIYIKGMFHNIRPTVTTDPNKLEQQAKEHLGTRSYAYVAGGAGERATVDANRAAFRAWKVSEALVLHFSSLLRGASPS